MEKLSSDEFFGCEFKNTIISTSAKIDGKRHTFAIYLHTFVADGKTDYRVAKDNDVLFIGEHLKGALQAWNTIVDKLDVD